METKTDKYGYDLAPRDIRHKKMINDYWCYATKIGFLVYGTKSETLIIPWRVIKFAAENMRRAERVKAKKRKAKP